MECYSNTICHHLHSLCSLSKLKHSRKFTPVDLTSCLCFIFCVSPLVSSSVSVHLFHLLCQSTCFIFCSSPLVPSSVSVHLFHPLCQSTCFILCVSPLVSSFVLVHLFHRMCQSLCFMLRTTYQTWTQVYTHRYIICNIHVDYLHYPYVIPYQYTATCLF
jgi:hypothetical protein